MGLYRQALAQQAGTPMTLLINNVSMRPKNNKGESGGPDSPLLEHAAWY